MIGVLFATQREADPLLKLLKIQADAPGLPEEGVFVFENLFFSTEEGAGQGVAVLCSGMGKTAAALGTKRLLDGFGVTSVVNMGIAGALVSGIAVGELFRVTQAVDWTNRVNNRFYLRDVVGGDLPGARLVTVDEAVFDPILRERLGAHGEMVDMEGAAVARICALRGVPCVEIKGISDMAGRGDRDTLMANIDRISGLLAQWVMARYCDK